MIKASWKINSFNNEDQFLAYVILMISQDFPEFRGKVFHVMNEYFIPKNPDETPSAYKERCKIYGNLNKSKGKLAGVPDVLILYNGILFKIELKQPGGSLQDSQKELFPIWNRDCCQIPVVICYTPYQVYLYCKKIITANLKIDFTPLFEKDIVLKNEEL